MIYKTKVKIDGIEITEAMTLEQTTPYITGVVLRLSTALTPMAIGASATDSIEFKMINPYKESFDGDEVEFYIKADGDTSANTGALEAEVGTQATDEAIDTNNAYGMIVDIEPGETPTAEELAEAEQVEAELIGDAYAVANGEEVAVPSAETTEEEAEDWVKVGTFYVYNQTNSAADNSASFLCFDALSRLNEDFTPASSNTTVQAMYNDLKAQIEANFRIPVDEYEFEAPYNRAISWERPTTYRGAMEYLAGLVGGYACVGSDDTLGISFYSYSDRIILDSDVRSYVNTSAGEMVLEHIECDRNPSPYKDDLIEVGTGQGIAFVNPFVNEAMLNDILALYRGIRYEGAKLTVSWDESIQSGQFYRIMTDDEYKNYLGLGNAIKEETNADELLKLKDRQNSLGKTILASNQAISFGGDATSRIESICDTEFSKSNPSMSPNDAKFRNLYADVLNADFIDANKIVTEGLQAGTAEIKQAIVDNIDVGAINGNKIKDGTIVAKALSNEAVTTLSGIKLYYTPDEPELTEQPDGSYSDKDGHVMRDGDTWYKTVMTVDDLVKPLNVINDTVKDTFENGVITRRVGVVDLGSLEWTYDGNNKFITRNNFGQIGGRNYISDLYYYSSTIWSTSSDTGTSAFGSLREFHARHNSYTDATAFKNAMQGVMLYYELATPYTEDGEYSNTVMSIWNNGEWAETPLDGSIIRANSITSQEIATNTITANNIEAGTITTREISSDYVYGGRIEAEQVFFGNKTAVERVEEAQNRADAYMQFDASNGLVIGDRRDGRFHGTTARLTSEQLGFYPASSDAPACYIGRESSDSAWSLYIEKGVIEDDLSFGQFQWITRTNGNMSLKWKG